MRLEGSGQLKNPMTSSGIEPATFWLVGQCLNQLRYRVPRYHEMVYKIPYYKFGDGHKASRSCIQLTK
jgi:hypothetical protein